MVEDNHYKVGRRIQGRERIVLNRLKKKKKNMDGSDPFYRTSDIMGGGVFGY